MKLFALVAVAGAALATAATAATPTLTLAASAPAAVYGKTVTLTGSLSTLEANQPITIKSVECGSTKATNAARTKTTTNGVYTATVTPVVNTTYQASEKNVQSNVVAVAVQPVVALKRVKRGSFKANVTAGLDLKGKFLLFQRYAKLRKRWVQVKRVKLTASTPGTKPTIVSTASFRAKAPKRARVRLLLSKAQAAPCYAAAKSNTVRN